MSRTGPAYIESESELFADLRQKQENDKIAKSTADLFIELYEFGKEIGDKVSIGGAKNANFQTKVDAHQGDYQNDPSVFTANVDGKLKIWPARMVIDHDPDLDSVAWDSEDYHEFKIAFQRINGVPKGSTSVKFETFASSADIEQFKSIVEEFVSTCRRKQLE